MTFPMPDAYLDTLAECRSCLAALADAMPFEESITYDGLLIDLDELHGGRVPPIKPVTGKVFLATHVEARLDRLIELGGASLGLELLFAKFQSAYFG